VSALEQRLEADLDLGRHRQLIGELEALVAEHPYRERSRAQLMLALYRSGRQAEALDAYQQARRTLADELGLEPSQDLKELEQSILRQDPKLQTIGVAAADRTFEGASLATSRMSRLPTGTVTFLFTDVEGSTRLLRELGSERYAEALEEHRDVLRDVCTRHGGAEVDAQGDSVFVAFATASGALAAARELTEALELGPIRVRIGVHTGTPLLTEEGYVGVDVHRAARIAAAAHGGQVLISESTAALVEEALRPLGKHRLRDLLEPLRLFQLGDGDFPEPASLGKTNLPVQPTPFVGRERELAVVLALLRDSRLRLLTLTGAGGSGKTRLALEVAAETAAEYPDGVFWVPLQALRVAKLVEPTIAQAVGARDDLASHLGSKRSRLLLDNFEQVISAAEVLGDLCSRLPNLKLLVTSREPLHLAAEREYPVPPLREGEAVAFFGDRARAVKPDFAEDDTLPEICRRLDCLPLAIELAAVRVKALSTEDLRWRLDKRLPLLTGGPRDAPERQRTLRATIAWSQELLSPEEKLLFARLSVFAGGFTLEAAEEVVTAELDTLQSLVDKSLLRHTQERFWMLETIREFASECLDQSGEAEQTRGRHARWFLELGEQAEPELTGAGQGVWLQRLDAEHDNIREALGWASTHQPQLAVALVGAVWRYWHLRALLREGLESPRTRTRRDTQRSRPRAHKAPLRSRGRPAQAGRLRSG
jgi:predicted ATPase/class 3 adenylate cyclase